MIGRPALFLDKDGVIVKPVNNEAPTDPKKLELIPEIIPVIKKARKLGFLIIIVSNQPDIATGLINEKNKNELEIKFRKLVKENNIFIDKIYYCHHNSVGVNKKYLKNCTCQKPKPGMLLKAKIKFNINMSKSFIVGDRASDIKAGKLAGVKTILYDIDSDQIPYLEKLRVLPDYKTNQLSEIIDIVSR